MTSTPIELVELLQESLGLSLKEAIKAAAKMKKMPKRSVYRQNLQEQNQQD